jgi:hypothetical protein
MNWGAHAARVLVSAASPKQSFIPPRRTRMPRRYFESGKQELRKWGKRLETRSAPALTHLLPRIRPVGFPIYIAPLGGSIHSLLPLQLYLLSRKSLSSIPAFLLSLLES